MGADCFPKDVSVEKALFWGSFTDHCERASEGSLEDRIVHVIMAILEVLPIIGQIVALVELLIIGCVAPQAKTPLTSRKLTPLLPEPTSLDIMQRFWQERVCSFKISHGTNSLYLSHFRQHGIGATYPPALEGMIARIRDVWGRHQLDVAPKTQYFCDFERRYDLAHQTKRVAFSFSANERITQEFTLGARQGGEWIRELRRFVIDARNNRQKLTDDEWGVILEVRTFIQVLDALPALIVRVHAGSADLVKQYGYRAPLFSTQDGFINHVKRVCPQWEDPVRLSSYLEGTLLPDLQREQAQQREKYEITINDSIAPEQLEFELVGGRRQPFSADYPKLAFDEPVTLSRDEAFKLRIDLTGFSYRKEYEDSRFTYDYDHSSRKTTVTRRRLAEEDRVDLALRNEMRAMRKAWLRAFNCDQVPLEEI
jgi:hypothetical protein